MNSEGLFEWTGRAEFDNRLLLALDNVLRRVFGEETAGMILHHIEKNKRLRKEEIPSRLDDFISGLADLLGQGGRVIESQVIQLLCSDLGVARVGKEFGFVESVRRLRDQAENAQEQNTLPRGRDLSVIHPSADIDITATSNKDIAEFSRASVSHDTGLSEQRSADRGAYTGVGRRDYSMAVADREIDRAEDTMERVTIGDIHRRFLDAIVDSVHDQISVKDEDLRFVLVNRALCVYLRRSEDQILGRTDHDLFPKDEADLLRRSDLEILERRHVLDIPEARLTDANGQVHVIHITKVPLKNALGEVTHIVGIARDITEKRRTEDQLEDFSEKLERMVDDRAEEFKQRSEAIRLLNESISQRLLHKISQIDNISRVREEVLRSPDLTGGLDLILDTALADLNMDAGAVLVVDQDAKTVVVRRKRGKTEGDGSDEGYALDDNMIELLAAKENTSFSRIVGGKERSILNRASVHCAPIRSGKKVQGILALGSQTDQVLDSSDLAVLGLYSELASTLFETQKLTVQPVKEDIRTTKKQYALEFGRLYLVKDDVTKAFEAFSENVLGGTEGLCITRELPQRVRRDYGLEKTPIVWLTEEKVEGQPTINSLQDLSILVGSFLENAERSIVLLDGFEYLITAHGFEPFVQFLHLTRSRFERSDSILIAPIFEKALDLREVRLIEREMRPLTAMHHAQ